MYTEKILRIVNVKVQGCWEMVMYTENCSELSMQSGKMLGIIDARRKNTRNRQYTQKKYTESSMQGARMLGNDKVCWKMDGIVKARWKNARISSMYAGKNTRSRKCTQEKYSESSMYTEKILEIVNARFKNAGKRQSMLKKCSESSMQDERMLWNDKGCWKNARNHQYKVKECSELSMQGTRILGNVNVKVQGCWEMAMYTEKCSKS